MRDDDAAHHTAPPATPAPRLVRGGEQVLQGACSDKLRVDKWLWAARFFKTRSLATGAVDAGKVLVNGARVKPAKALKPGDELLIRTAVLEYTVRVVQLAERRGPAKQAAQLYAETDDSRRKREAARLEHGAQEHTAGIRGRPTKRARRQLQKVRGDDW